MDKSARKEMVREYYDRQSMEDGGFWYNSPRHQSARWVDEKLALIRSVLDGLGTTGKVLDVGCQYGMLGADLIRRGYEYWGIDISEGVIRTARTMSTSKGINGAAHFIQGDAEALQFPSGFFDVVVMSYVLEYLDSDDKALSEVRRVLKPGGFLIVGLTNKYSWNKLVRLMTLRPLKYMSFLFPSGRHGIQSFADRSHNPAAFRSRASAFGLTYVSGHYCNFGIVPFNFRYPSWINHLNTKLGQIMKTTGIDFAFTTYVGAFRAG
jgi:ubiquinone/menaquinone biosynthesis C-methylase UbiE